MDLALISNGELINHSNFESLYGISPEEAVKYTGMNLSQL
jgi:hypothetical protein